MSTFRRANSRAKSHCEAFPAILLRVSTVVINAEAMMILVIVGAFPILVMFGIGWRKYALGISIVRSNYLAIGAARHPLPEKHEVVYRLLS